jgi:hypothetical protein
MEHFKQRVAYLKETLDYLIAQTERQSLSSTALEVSDNL